MNLLVYLGIGALILGLGILLAGLVITISEAYDKPKVRRGPKILLYGALTLLCSFTLCSISVI